MEIRLIRLRGYFKVMIAALVMTLLFAVPAMAKEEEPAITGLKQTGATSNNVRVEWDSLNVEGVMYSVEYSEDSKTFFEVEGNVNLKTNKITITGLDKGKVYYVRVIAYVKEGDDDVYITDYSSVCKAATVPDVVEVIGQTNATKTDATYSWYKVPGATGYKIYKVNRYNANDMKLIATTKKTSYVFKKSKSTYKNYYAKIVAVIDTGSYEVEAYDKVAIKVYNAKYKPDKAKMKSVKYNDLYKKTVLTAKNQSKEGYNYQIFTSGGKRVLNKNTKSGTLNTGVIKTGQFYKVRCRYYVSVKNKKIYGDWSDYTYIARKPQITVSLSNGTNKVSWKKVGGASKYSVYVSTDKHSGYKKVASTKKNYCMITKFNGSSLSDNKVYYVYVVAEKKVGSKTVKSPISKKVELKKR